MQTAATFAAGEVLLKLRAFFLRELVVHSSGEPRFDVFVNVWDGGHLLFQRRERRLQAFTHCLQRASENSAERTVR